MTDQPQPREKRKSTATGLAPLARRPLFVDDTPARREAVAVVDKRSVARAALALTLSTSPPPKPEIKRGRGRPKKAKTK